MTDATKTCLRVNAPHVIHETIDGEVIVINLSSGSYYSLRGSGAAVWAVLETRPSSLDEVVLSLGHVFDAPAEQLERSVGPFLEQLMNEELIIRAALPEEETPAPAKDSLPSPLEAFEAPSLEKYTDMQDLVLLDPVHEVDQTGWPQARPDDGAAVSGAPQT